MRPASSLRSYRQHLPLGQGLEIRYRPRARLGHSLILMAPWLNVLILIAAFLVLHGQLALKPGVVVDLPRLPFREGLNSGAPLVLMSVEGVNGRESVAFFDDERFRLSESRQLKQLQKLIASNMMSKNNMEVVLHAEREVPHGDVLSIVNLAREAGVLRVNISARIGEESN